MILYSVVAKQVLEEFGLDLLDCTKNAKTIIPVLWEESKERKQVLLVKCDPSTQWWSTFWDYDAWVCQDCADCIMDKLLKNKGQVDGREVQACIYCNAHIAHFYMKYNRSGPKPGCEVRFFPKRIKFDPPQELINSGEVWDLNSSTDALKALAETLKDMGKYKPKWVQKCKNCFHNQWIPGKKFPVKINTGCIKCNGNGYVELSGPTFSSALLIFDRRSL